MKPVEFPMATLPTFRLIAVAWVVSAAVALAWIGVTWVVARAHLSIAPLLTAGVVAVGATVVFVSLRPWKPRSLATWPIVWVVGSFLRMAATLGGAFLLYSSTPYGGRTLWLSAMAAYIAVMVCETRVYVHEMSRFQPTPGGASPAGKHAETLDLEDGPVVAETSRPAETSAASGAE